MESWSVLECRREDGFYKIIKKCKGLEKEVDVKI